MAERCMKQSEINENVEISVPLDDCGLDVRNPFVNQNCLKEIFKRETPILETNISFSSKALDPNESNVAGPVSYMEDAVSGMKNILNGADSVEEKQQNTLPKETSSELEEGSNDMWSDFASYCKMPLIQQQSVGTFCEFPVKEENDSVESSSLQSSKVLNDNFKNHHPFPAKGHKSHKNYKCDNESKYSILVVNDQEVSTPKLDSSRNVEGNRGQSVTFADSTTCECDGQLVKDAFRIDCSETELSDFAPGRILFPTASPFLQIQAILSANSALKADAWNLVENIFRNSFPSIPARHAFEDFPALVKPLEINGEGGDPNKALASTSYDFSNTWEDLQDLNKVALRSSWNLSHTREKLLSILGIDQNQKDDGQANLEDAMASYSDLEKTGVLPGDAALPDNGPKALIKTRISVTPSQRAGHGFSHRLETVFLQWMQMNGNRARETPRIKRHSWFI